MADARDPGKAPKARRRPHPSGQGKLASRVYKRANQHPHIKGNPTGRPKKPDALKAAFLGCLRYGLNIESALDIVGVSDSVLKRWRDESAHDAMPFQAEIARAIATPKLKVSRKLIEAAEDGDMGAAMFYLKSRAAEYQGKGEFDTTHMGRQIREFVTAAMESMEGSSEAGEELRREYPEEEDEDGDS